MRTAAARWTTANCEQSSRRTTTGKRNASATPRLTPTSRSVEAYFTSVQGGGLGQQTLYSALFWHFRADAVLELGQLCILRTPCFNNSIQATVPNYRKNFGRCQVHNFTLSPTSMLTFFTFTYLLSKSSLKNRIENVDHHNSQSHFILVNKLR